MDKNLEQSVSRLKRKKYNPIPARRVYIPKSETEKRPLGISALEHKIAERGIMWILERIYEQDLGTVRTDFVRRGTVVKAEKS